MVAVRNLRYRGEGGFRNASPLRLFFGLLGGGHHGMFKGVSAGCGVG